MDEIYHYEKRIVQVEELIIKDKDVLKFLMEREGVNNIKIFKITANSQTETANIILPSIKNKNPDLVY